MAGKNILFLEIFFTGKKSLAEKKVFAVERFLLFAGKKSFFVAGRTILGYRFFASEKILGYRFFVLEKIWAIDFLF